MGQKSHPRGLRLGVSKDWDSIWHKESNFAQQLQEDDKIREYLRQEIGSAGVDELKIQRSAKEIEVDLVVARPGLVIGRGGSTIERIKKELDKMLEGKVRLNVQEVTSPNLSAALVAENIVTGIQRRYPYKRAANSSIRRVMDAGAEGVKIFVSGRLGGHTISRTEKFEKGTVPTSTLDKEVDYAHRVARTPYGTIGVKVWITQPEKEQR